MAISSLHPSHRPSFSSFSNLNFLLSWPKNKKPRSLTWSDASFKHWVHQKFLLTIDTHPNSTRVSLQACSLSIVGMVPDPVAFMQILLLRINSRQIVPCNHQLQEHLLRLHCVPLQRLVTPASKLLARHRAIQAKEWTQQQLILAAHNLLSRTWMHSYLILIWQTWLALRRLICSQLCRLSKILLGGPMQWCLGKSSSRWRAMVLTCIETAGLGQRTPLRRTPTTNHRRLLHITASMLTEPSQD